MKYFIIFISIIFNTYGNDDILDLKEVIKISKENNPKVIGIKEKINQFDAQTRLTKSYLFPTLSWNLNGNYQKDAVYTGTPKFNGDPYNQYGSDLKITQPLYTKGMYSAISQIDIDKNIQKLNLEIEERNLTLNIIEAFYRFILNQRALENLLKNQEIIQKALTTSHQRFNMGRGQLLDILQVKTQLALIQPQLEQARSQLIISGQQLINYMGDKERSSLKLKGILKTLVLKEVQSQINLSVFKLPEYEINQLQISQIDYGRDVIMGKHFPTIKLVGDYLYNNYKKSEIFSDYSNSWVVQLQVSIPLFSGLSSVYERNSLSSQDRQLKIARNDLENSLAFKQVTSFRNLEASESSLLSSEAAVKLAEEAQKEATRLYKLSQIDFLQFLTVQQSALQAKSNLDQLKFQNIIAYSNYFTSSGQSLDILVDILTMEKK